MTQSEQRVEVLRYSRDRPDWYGIDLTGSNSWIRANKVRNSLLGHSVKVVPDLFPQLAAIIDRLVSELNLSDPIEVYIYNQAEAQAQCWRVEGGIDVIVLLSSGIVKLLSPEELCFVIGHELGHYLLKHHQYPRADSSEEMIERANIMELQRAAEISADRLGYICCESITDAFKAIIKVATGLPDEYIRMDVSAYIDQLRSLNSIGGVEQGIYSTHPMFPVRVKALLWFSMSEPYYRWKGTKGPVPIAVDELDTRIANDLARATGFSLEHQRESRVQLAELWVILALSLTDKNVSKEEQLFLTRNFGEDMAKKAVNYLMDNGIQGVATKVEESLVWLSTQPFDIRCDFISSIERFVKSSGELAADMTGMLGGIAVRIGVSKKEGFSAWDTKAWVASYR